MENVLLTDEEEAMLDIFTKLLSDTGDLNRHVLVMPHKDMECRLIIRKNEGKWISYIKEREVIDPVIEYDNLYDCCMDAFENLEKSSTDFCTELFPVLVQDISKDKVKSKKL